MRNIDAREFGIESNNTADNFEAGLIGMHEGVPEEAKSGNKVTKVHIVPEEFMNSQPKNNNSTSKADFAKEALESIKKQTLAMSNTEENDEALQKMLGRTITNQSSSQQNRQSSYEAPYARKVPTTGGGSPSNIPSSQSIVPRPPITPQQVSASNANGFLFNMTKKKDECVVPIKQVSLFIANVMGEDFGYITKKMAKNMLAMIPEEAAILAIQTSKDDAKKFLDSDNSKIRKEAIKKFFDIDDDDIEKFETILSTPGFEVNPWS